MGRHYFTVRTRTPILSESLYTRQVLSQALHARRWPVGWGGGGLLPGVLRHRHYLCFSTGSGRSSVPRKWIAKASQSIFVPSRWPTLCLKFSHCSGRNGESQFRSFQEPLPGRFIFMPPRWPTIHLDEQYPPTFPLLQHGLRGSLRKGRRALSLQTSQGLSHDLRATRCPNALCLRASRRWVTDIPSIANESGATGR